jgi:hypothetical protein
MQFKEAFELMQKGKICRVENTEYRLWNNYPPRLEHRNLNEECWFKFNNLDYFLFTLASDLWEVSNEDN